MSATYSAGEARLAIVPDATNFKRRLEAEIRRVNAELPVDVDTRRATEHIDRFRDEQSRRDVNVKVDLDTRQAQAQLTALRAEVDKFAGSSIGAGNSLKSALSLGGIAGIVAFNPAMITGLADVAQGLQQVAQAGLAIPGAIGGAASSVGTLALGLYGMSDALKAADKAADGSAKNVQAYNEALAKLSPAAAEVVTTIGDLRPMFDDLQRATSQELFAGVSDQMRQLAATEFPLVLKGAREIAQAWNTDIKQLALTVGDNQSQSILDRLFGNTADAQRRAAAAIDPIVKGIGTLTAASSDALPRLADGLGAVSERFDRFIEAADKDGRLNKWIDDGITGASHLGESVLNIGKAFTAITTANGAGGANFLQWLDRATGKLQSFLNSDAGQDKLKKMFESGREELEQLEPVIKNLGPILGAVFDAAQNSTNIWLPLLREVTDILAQDPALVEAVATAFIAWKTIDGVVSLLSALGSVTTALTALPGVAATAGTGAAAGLAPLAAALAPIAATVGALTLGLGGLAIAMQHTDLGSDRAQTTFGARGLGPLVKQYQRSGDGSDNTAGWLGGGADGSFEVGGPTPSGRGRGPTGGHVIEVHGDEWILPKHARTAIGDGPLWDITRGRSFSAGGFLDPNGNAVTPANTSRPPALQSGLGGMAQAALSAVPFGGPIGNFVTMLNTPAPDPSTQTVSQQMGIIGQTEFGTPAGNFMAAASTLPGLWGMAASLASPDPAGAMMNWGTQTVGWLSNFASGTLSSFGSALINGGLGMVGLQQSILSPSNPWNQAGQQVANFALGGSGPLAEIMGGGGRGGAGAGANGGGASLAGQVSGGTTGTDTGGLGLSDMFGIGPSSSAGGIGSGAGNRLPLNWKTIDAIAAQMGLTMTSGYRDPNGPTIAGVPAAKSYHALGRAHDYSNGVRTPQELQFAMFMAQNYGPKLKELIHDDPRFPYNINNGSVVGPFGSFYTLAQAGNHADHVHVAFDTGGWLMPGVTVSHNNTGWPELTVNRQGQQKLVDRGINPASLLAPGAPGTPPPPLSPTPGAPGAAGQPSPDGQAAPPVPLAPPPGPAPVPDQNGQQPAGDDIARAAEKLTAAGAGMGAAPASRDHTLPALNSAIMAGASNIGSWISTAVSAAAAGGSMGMGGGAGASLASPLIQGGIQQGAKLLTGGLNILSSFLVGNIPGSFGAADDPTGYGQVVRAQQREPLTAAAPRIQNNTFHGMDVPRVFQELDLRDAQHKQAALAGYRG